MTGKVRSFLTRVIYETPGSEPVEVLCDRVSCRQGEGANGPFILEIWEGVGQEEELVAAVSRVTSFRKENLS